MEQRFIKEGLTINKDFPIIEWDQILPKLVSWADFNSEKIEALVYKNVAYQTAQKT